MTIFDIFFLFFMISALQPVLQQRMLEAMRTRKIAQIERERGSRVITMIHRQETMRLLGFPVVRFIDIHDSEAIIRAIQMTDRNVPIDLIIHTPGGLVLAALQIARALKRHPAKTTVFVPHYAMSGGTLIALAADEIVMCEHSVLGPVDPQVNQWPAASIVRAAESKPVEHVEDRTLILADVSRKAIVQVQTAVEELLDGKMPKEKAKEVAALLAQGTWTHDYPITPEQARELGLPVSTDMPEAVLELMSLYPQPVRMQPGGVEYIPEPRHGGGMPGRFEREA